MKRKLKKYLRTGLALAGTGIGLSVMSGMDSTGATSKMSKAMPMIGGLAATGMAIDMVNGLYPKKKKK